MIPITLQRLEKVTETLAEFLGFPPAEPSKDAFASGLIGAGSFACGRFSLLCDLHQDTATVGRIRDAFDQAVALEAIHEFGHGARGENDLLGE